MIIASVAVAFVAYILPASHAAKIFFGQRSEGDFRTTRTRAVLNAEQIFTLRGEGAERESWLRDSFNASMRTTRFTTCGRGCC